VITHAFEFRDRVVKHHDMIVLFVSENTSRGYRRRLSPQRPPAPILAMPSMIPPLLPP